MTETTNAVRCAVCGQPLGPGIHTGVSGGATFHAGCSDRWKDAEIERLRKRVERLELELRCVIGADTLYDLERAKGMARSALEPFNMVNETTGGAIA